MAIVVVQYLNAHLHLSITTTQQEEKVRGPNGRLQPLVERNVAAGGRKLRCARTEAGRTGATVTTTSQLDDAASASACWLSGSTAPNGRPCPRARRRRHRACGVRPGEGSDAWERAWPAGAFQASSRRRHHTPAVRDLDFPARMQHGGDFSLVRGILTAT
jgi:hypothetical protein